MLVGPLIQGAFTVLYAPDLSCMIPLLSRFGALLLRTNISKKKAEAKGAGSFGRQIVREKGAILITLLQHKVR